MSDGDLIDVGSPAAGLNSLNRNLWILFKGQMVWISETFQKFDIQTFPHTLNPSCECRITSLKNLENV